MDQFRDFANHVSKRPAMYLGQLNVAGVLYLIGGVLAELTDMAPDTDLHFDLQADKGKKYRLDVSGITAPEQVTDNIFGRLGHIHFLKLLCAVSATCRISFNQEAQSCNLLFEDGNFSDCIVGQATAGNKLQLVFELSDTFFNHFPDHFELSGKLYEFAVLNRNITLALQDGPEPALNRNVYHFPEGVRRLFNNRAHRLKDFTEVLFIDERYNDNHYQVGIGFHRSYLEEQIISYAGNNRTHEGGSLEDGILRGIIDAYKAYKKFADPLDIDYLIRKISLHDLKARLVIVCKVNVPGNIYGYYGAVREKLDMPGIKKDVRCLVGERVYNCLKDNPEFARKYCHLF